jgi:hypothetical protein
MAVGQTLLNRLRIGAALAVSPVFMLTLSREI